MNEFFKNYTNNPYEIKKRNGINSSNFNEFETPKRIINITENEEITSSQISELSRGSVISFESENISNELLLNQESPVISKRILIKTVDEINEMKENGLNECCKN